jgi:hypothetical protein
MSTRGNYVFENKTAAVFGVLSRQKLHHSLVMPCKNQQNASKMLK